MITILIADDHAVVRRGLRQILEEESDIKVVHEASSGNEALELLRRKKVDVAVLDITMPGKSGLEVLKDLRLEFPKLPVLLLSMHPEDQFAVRALKAGAAGYLTKEGAPEDLVRAIRKVHRGGRFITPSVAERIADDLSKPAQKQPHEYLSEREFAVLCLIGRGKSVTEIADALSLSVKTVSTYRSRILQKMNFKTTTALIQYAVKNRLVE